jgi:hypothetical protein
MRHCLYKSLNAALTSKETDKGDEYRFVEQGTHKAPMYFDCLFDAKAPVGFVCQTQFRRWGHEPETFCTP